ncbi:MAG: archaetidylinositol phosphate synthase [Patescibacteria group bacterium]|jgi:phosphatidylglycerophosphate synthase|nr:archaetidylinositol phosphate synthase [Patescibacteria group bacterium]
MELHRASKIPDWAKVPSDKRNIFQIVAEKTRGIVTPGNAVSVAGLVLTHNGLVDIKRGRTILGTSKVVVGRAMDIADGYVADKTGTKSSIGEKFDATIDKLLMADALLALHQKEIVPTMPALLIGAQNIVNTVATGIATVRNNEIHSSREGKITTVMQWAAIGGYCLDAINNHDQSLEQASVLRHATDAVTIASTALGVFVNVDYSQTALQQQVEEI